MNRIVQSFFKVKKSVQYIPKCSCSGQNTPSYIPKDVPGLGKKVVEVTSEAVGFPGATKNGLYKNPEYFCYHNTSFYEAEIELSKFRLPQPSNKVQK